MAVAAPIYAVLGGILGVVFTYPGKGILGALIAGIVGFAIGYMAGSIPGFGLLATIGPGIIMVPGVAGVIGFTVASYLL